MTASLKSSGYAAEIEVNFQSYRSTVSKGIFIFFFCIFLIGDFDSSVPEVVATQRQAAWLSQHPAAR